MRLALAHLLHRIEWTAARLRLKLKVRSCQGCACDWPTTYEEYEDFGGVPRRFRTHMMPTSGGEPIGCDCMEDPI